MRRPADTTLIAVLLAVLFAACPAHAARSDWRELSVSHFHLYSTLSDSSTRTVARNLQAFEQTVGMLLRTDDRLPDVPTYIYLLGARDFKQYASPHPGVGGFFHEGPAWNTIVVNGDEDFDWVKIAVFHEYTHFIQRNSRTVKLPPWYVEGYAELFSSFRLTKDGVMLGEAPKGMRISTAAMDWIPVERLLAVKATDPEYRAEKLMPQFYSESWALVHLLLFDDKTLRGPTGDYLQSIDVGYPEPDAFKNNFPFDKAGLDVALRKLIRGEVIHISRLALENPPAIDQAPVNRLTAAQADAEIARLMLSLKKPPSIVGPMIAQALAEAPADVSVKALAARIRAHDSGIVDIPALSALAAEEPTTVRVRIDIADALLADGGSVEAGKSVLALLDGTVHAPDPPIEAVLLWSRAAELGELAPANVVSVVEPAALRAPHNTRLLRDLAAASERLRDKPKARAYYTRIILVSQIDQERAWAQKQADSARLLDDPLPTAAPAAPPSPAGKPKSPTTH